MKFFLTLFFIAFAAGCTQPSNVGTQPGTAPATSPPVSNGGVFSDPASYAGRTVDVEGVFQGFRLDQCKFASSARSTSLTRSDWLLRHDSMCLYVSGNAPAGIDPIEPTHIGRTVKLRARVTDDGSGKYLLQP